MRLYVYNDGTIATDPPIVVNIGSQLLEQFYSFTDAGRRNLVEQMLDTQPHHSVKLETWQVTFTKGFPNR